MKTGSGEKSMRAAVLGVGNLLMSDEGVGVHAVSALVERYDFPDEVEIIDGGTSGMELLPELEGLDHLIVVDAVRAGKPAGSLVRLAGEDVPVFFKIKFSPHQVGLSDIFAALRFKGTSPGEVVIVGVEPESLDLNMSLSPTVAARLDEVVEMVVAELARVGISALLKK
ncbi:hydrogenase 2 maturation endopeptidase [Alphaproteobacteria bacterium]|nr:hydrogenase 2 maturation endopeptidase [Alphaproteobacteria bacterium]